MYTAAVVGAVGFPTPMSPSFLVNDGVTRENETADSLTTFRFFSDPN